MREVVSVLILPSVAHLRNFNTMTLKNMANNHYISDELLAAYLEGNTNEHETLEVIKALKADPELRETLEIAMEIDETESLAYDVLPMMRLAAESGKNVCSVLCEACILHRRGIPFEEKDLLAIAQKHHWLKPEGSPLHSIGQLLAHYGLMVTRKYDATIEDINKAISLDNDVIVVVDKEKLYQVEDLEDAPNHAVVVRNIQNECVELFDPSEKNTEVKVTLASFLPAWKESHYYMIRVLQSIEDYEPQPINLDEIELTDELLELREAIAENAHDVWATARIKEGWSYGTERDDAAKKHPDLIPYSSLPDSEKEYDRLMALDTIKLVKKLGFEINKK